MKRIKYGLIGLLFLLPATKLLCQDFVVPDDVKLEKAEDYATYEKDILNCISWMVNTPLDEQKDKRKEVNTFFLQWVSGAPNVTIEINSNVVNFTDKNTEFLMIFMAGWTKYALENPDSSKDMVKGNLAGIQSVIEVYKKGVGVKKDAKVDKLIKLSEENKLESWVKEQLEKK